MGKSERLYKLLPAIYRLKDQALGEPLRAYLATMEIELEDLEANIASLYENWFIETCDDWVIPYIGNLLDVKKDSCFPARAVNFRAEVGNALRLRRRKGTLLALAEAVTTATGWPSFTVEYLDLLVKTQSLNHLHLEQGQTVNVRALVPPALINTPFDPVPRRVDVHAPPKLAEYTTPNSAGKYNLHNVGLFLWRLKSYPVQWAEARKGEQPGCFNFNPFGVDTPLFSLPAQLINERWSSNEAYNTLEQATTSSAGRDFYRDAALKTHPFYGLLVPYFRLFYRQLPFTLKAIPDDKIQICDLSQWQLSSDMLLQSLSPSHSSDTFMVDPSLGRIYTHGGISEQLWVSYAYGFSANIGGGPYHRMSMNHRLPESPWRAFVSQTSDFPTHNTEEYTHYYCSIIEALAAWAATEQNGVIFIADNGTYSLESTPESLADINRLRQGKQHSLEILAAQGMCPCLVGDLNITGCFAGIKLALNGLWIDGTVTVSGTVSLQIQDCTISPPKKAYPVQPSILTKGAINEFSNSYELLQISISDSILGPILVSNSFTQLYIQDSIVDGGCDNVAISESQELQSDNFQDSEAYFCLDVIRTTVIGNTNVTELRANSVIFNDALRVLNTFEGFIRYSYFPSTNSQAPNLCYRCQTDLALEKINNPDSQATILGNNKPHFASLTYGNPSYAQLTQHTPLEILLGSETGSEMGVFERLNLQTRYIELQNIIAEYLPCSLEAHVTIL